MNVTVDTSPAQNPEQTPARTLRLILAAMRALARQLREAGHRVLIDGAGKPAGGQWNFDAEKRTSPAALNWLDIALK